MLFWTSEAMLEFCNYKVFLIVTAEAISLDEIFITTRAGCKDVLATKQPSPINAWNLSLEDSGNLDEDEVDTGPTDVDCTTIIVNTKESSCSGRPLGTKQEVDS